MRELVDHAQKIAKLALNSHGSGSNLVEDIKVFWDFLINLVEINYLFNLK